MKKQYQFGELGAKKIALFATALFGVVFSTKIFAQDADIQRYEQAKLPLVYQGEVGALLQQLAQRLNVGFISYEWDITQKIAIQNQQDNSIKALFSALESNLSNTHIRFEKIGKRLFLVASAKNAEPLIVATPEKEEPTQFIGNVVFGENESSAQPSNQVNQANQNSEISQKFTALATQVTDKNLIAKNKNKKAPQYKVTSKERLGLENIRVTPLGTFLIFKNTVNTQNLTVRTKVENAEMYQNMIVISHQKQNAPVQIEIRDKAGKSLVLRNTLK